MKSLVALIVTLLALWVGFVTILAFAILGTTFVEALFPHMNFIEKGSVYGIFMFLSTFTVVRVVEAVAETKPRGGRDNGAAPHES